MSVLKSKDFIKKSVVEETLSAKNLEKEKTICSDVVDDYESLYNERCASINKLDTSICAENELINLDDVHLSDDEDTWLYASPKNLSKEEKGMSPYKWLRKDVEDPTNHQLQIAKSALVSKLDELDILGCTQNYNKLRSKSLPIAYEDANKNISLMNFMSDNGPENEMDIVTEIPELGLSLLEEEKVSSNLKEPEKPKLNNVSDVLERARQQEESLKLSSSKFFYEAARTFPRATRINSSQASRSSNVSKPASIETLYTHNGKQNPVTVSCLNVAQKKLLHSSPNHSPFGSTASLNLPHDLHRGSLPNLNRNYFSLRTKKSKRTSEHHIQCPLPIYPRIQKEETAVKPETTLPKSALHSSNTVYGESKTLPSFYRTKSKKTSISNNIEPIFSAIRRDSSPSTFCQKSNPIVNSPRRESSPCVSSQRSLRRNTGMHSHYSGSVPVLQHSKAVSMTSLPPNISESQKLENIISSHNKRQPLSSVHNRSPKYEDKLMIHDDDLSKLNLPSKIPSPSLRSGIPVPSTQYTVDKSNTTNESWNQDFY